MEMFTCSGFSSGPRIFNFGTVASGIQSLWRRQENFLICVGKMTLNIVILGVTRTNTVHSADDTYIFYNSAFFKRYNWQSYNFEKYGLPVETPPIGKLLLYPIQVIWLLYCDNVTIWESLLPGEYRGRAHQPRDVWDIPWLQRDCQGPRRKKRNDSWEINNITLRDLGLITEL